MKIIKKGNYMEIAGKLYTIDSDKSRANKKMEELEFHEVKENINKMCDIIAEKLKNSVNADEIIKNALFDLDEEDIKKIFLKVTKQKIKPKMRKRYGCFILDVEGIDIPIRY